MLIAQVSDIHAAPENDHLNRFDQVLIWLAHLQTSMNVSAAMMFSSGHL